MRRQRRRHRATDELGHAQRQRRRRERGFDDSGCGNHAGRREKQVFMIVRATVCIDDRICGIRTHDRRSHDVVMVLHEPGIAQAFRCEGRDQAAIVLLRHGGAGAYVIADIIMNAQLRQPQGILVLAQSQTVCRQRQRLHERRKTHIASRVTADARVQFRPDESLAQGACGHGSVRNRISERVSKGGMLPAKCTVAPGTDTALTHGPSPRPQLVLREHHEIGTGVIHEIASHLIRGIRDFRKQQQLRRLEPIRSHDETACREPRRPAIGGPVMHGGDLAAGGPFQFECDGVLDEPGAGLLGKRGMHVAGVLRTDRTDRRAVVHAAAGGPTFIGLRRARVRLIAEPEAGRARLGRKFARVRTPRHHRQRKGLGPRRKRAAPVTALIIVGVAADAERLLGARVPRLERLIVERPIAPDSVQGLNAHVVRQVPPTGAAPGPSRAADEFEHARAERDRSDIFDVLVGIMAAGIRETKVRLVGGVAKVLDDPPARHARTRLEHDHGLSGARESMSGETAEYSGTDHDHIGVELRAHRRRAKRARPNTRGRRSHSSESA
jgi:hypothetical protein